MFWGKTRQVKEQTAVGERNCCITWSDHEKALWGGENLSKNQKRPREEDAASRRKNIFLKNIFLFTWLCRVLVAACGLLSCGMWTLSCGMHVGSSSLARHQSQAPLHWERGVLATAPPGKSRRKNLLDWWNGNDRSLEAHTWLGYWRKSKEASVPGVVS